MPTFTSEKDEGQETYGQKKILFCPYCGTRLDDGARFCKNCGAQVEKSEPPRYKNREQEYAGKMIKCPACGEEIPSFTAICPSCGHEIIAAKLSPALKEFIDSINECDSMIADAPKAKRPKKGWQSWNTGRRVLWVILNIYTLAIPLVFYLTFPLMRSFFKRNASPELTPTERRKASLIENFTFPNDRESMLEALLFAKSKIAFLASDKLDEKNIYWFRLWYTKSVQLYQKANILLTGDSIANTAYEDIVASKKTFDKKIRNRAIFGATIILVFFGILFLAGISE